MTLTGWLGAAAVLAIVVALVVWRRPIRHRVARVLGEAAFRLAPPIITAPDVVALAPDRPTGPGAERHEIRRWVRGRYYVLEPKSTGKGSPGSQMGRAFAAIRQNGEPGRAEYWMHDARGSHKRDSYEGPA